MCSVSVAVGLWSHVARGIPPFPSMKAAAPWVARRRPLAPLSPPCPAPYIAQPRSSPMPSSLLPAPPQVLYHPIVVVDATAALAPNPWFSHRRAPSPPVRPRPGAAPDSATVRRHRRPSRQAGESCRFRELFYPFF